MSMPSSGIPATSAYTTAPRGNTMADMEGPYRQLEMKPVADGPYQQLRLAGSGATGASGNVPPRYNLSPPFADVNTITPEDFARLTGIRDVGEGKSGAMFLNCAKGGFFVKSDSDCHSEKFAADLFKTLPVNVPEIRVVSVNDFQRAITALESNQYDNRDCRALAGLLKRNSHFMLQSILTGCNLKSPTNFANGVFMNLPGRARLFIIGMMVAYDLVIENCDRFPSVISKHDNFGNLMLSRMGVQSGEIDRNVVRPTAIDQKVSDFSHQDLERQIPEKFRIDILLHQALDNDDVRRQLAVGVVNCLRSKNVTVHADAVTAVKDGITEGLSKLASGNQATLKELRDRVFASTGEARDRQLAILNGAIGLLEAKNFQDVGGRLIIRNRA